MYLVTRLTHTNTGLCCVTVLKVRKTVHLLPINSDDERALNCCCVMVTVEKVIHYFHILSFIVNFHSLITDSLFNII